MRALAAQQEVRFGRTNFGSAPEIVTFHNNRYAVRLHVNYKYVTRNQCQ